MAKIQEDSNQFIEIKDNKLSRPGVFKYYGREIGAPDQDRIYNVYRPKEELKDPECIESFKLLPWIIEHRMLGKNYNSPAEKKGIHGVIGQDVRYDDKDDCLKGNIKIFTEKLENEIDSGTNELSLGYKCVYDFTTQGVFDGERYEVVQRKIRGNHLASVEESRMDVAVGDSAMDNLTVKFNLEEGCIVGKEIEEGQDAGLGKKTIDDFVNCMNAAIPALREITKFGQDMKAKDEEKGKDEESEDEDEAKDEEKEKAKDGDKQEKSSGMDAAAIKAIVECAIKPLQEKVDALSKQSAAMDSAAFIKQINDRDKLASELSVFVGTFDHSAKTLAEVAKYGIEKLEIPAESGQEVSAVKAWLHNRPKPSGNLFKHNGQDAAASADSPVAQYINGK